MENYQFTESIGKGTYGAVVKATHIPSGRIVAVKRAHPHKVEEGIQPSTLREIALLRRLDSPHVIRYAFHPLFSVHADDEWPKLT